MFLFCVKPVKTSESTVFGKRCSNTAFHIFGGTCFTKKDRWKQLCRKFSAVTSRRFRREKKAIFKEPVFKAQAALGDKTNFVLLSFLTQAFRGVPVMKHIVPCSWTAVFVSEKEYVKMSSYLLRQCLVWR